MASCLLARYKQIGITVRLQAEGWELGAPYNQSKLELLEGAEAIGKSR